MVNEPSIDSVSSKAFVIAAAAAAAVAEAAHIYVILIWHGILYKILLLLFA